MKDIYTSVAINKTASLVVNQSGCTSHNGLSDEQLLSNLKHRYHYIFDICQGLKKNSEALKKYLTENYGYKCSCCNISEWNNKPLSLEIDHKDGNPYNNDISNLRYICPNCHSQTPTYKGKNKGNGRVERRDRARLDFHRQKICP